MEKKRGDQAEKRALRMGTEGNSIGGRNAHVVRMWALIKPSIGLALVNKRLTRPSPGGKVPGELGEHLDPHPFAYCLSILNIVL